MRGLRRRVVLTAISIAVGTVGALALAAVFPQGETKEHWRSCLGHGPDFASPFLVLAGAIALSIAAYVALAPVARQLGRWALRPVLPSARIVRLRLR